MDYINREDAIEALKLERWGINLALESETLPYETREMLYQRRGQVSSDINTIKNLSAADVVEHKKGSWINHRNDNGHNIADCSLCGDTLQWFDVEATPKYCCMCGAELELTCIV